MGGSSLVSRHVGYTRSKKSRLRGEASAAERIRKWNKHEVEMDSSKKGPENGCHKYKGVKHTRAGTWAAQIWEPHRKSKLYLGTFRSALEAALAYDEAARQMFGRTTKLNFPNYSLCEDHDEDCPTVITVSTSDSTNSSILRDPFVNIKRKARTSVVNRGDDRSMSRFIKILEPELKKKAVRKASRERSIKSLINTDIQRLCTAEKLTYLGYQGDQTGLHDGSNFIDIDQKDEASSSVSSQPIDCTRKRKRKTVRQRRGAKGVAEIQGKWKDCNNKLDFLVNEEKPMRRAHSKGSKKGRMNGKGCQRKEANAVCIYRGVRKRLHGKWGADIWLPGMGSRLWLGTFRSEMEAALAYDEGARAMHGSYARLNFPNYSLSEDFNKDSPSCIIISSADTTSSSIAEDPLNNIMRKARTRKANNKDGEGISRVDEGHLRLQSLSTLPIVEEAAEPELKEEEVGKASGEPCLKSLLYNDMQNLCTAEKPDCEGTETEPDKVDHICLWGEIFSVDELLDALNSVPSDFHGAEVTEITCHSLDMKLLTEMGQTTSDGFDFFETGGTREAPSYNIGSSSNLGLVVKGVN